MRPETNRPRLPSLTEALIPLGTLVLLLSIGCGLLRWPLPLMLLMAAGVAAIVAHRIGYGFRDMLQGIINTLRKAMPALLIILAVGVLIATWIGAGTIPMLIYYGLHLTSARFFLLTASLICSAVSLCTGTSWGTIGTIGVALMGIAHASGVPADAAAGAIVSGAYFGDKLSPLSDQTNLAPAIVGANIFDHIRWLLWTTGPAWLLALGIYLVAGYTQKAAAPAHMSELELTLHSSFHFTALLLLPPLLMFWFVVTNRSTLLGMLLASAAAGALAVFVQAQPWMSVIQTVFTGYKATTHNGQVDALLTRGGILAMTHVIMLLLAAFVYAGIMVHCGLLARTLRAILGETCGTFQLIAATVISGIVTGLVTGSSHLSVIVPGQLFADAYRGSHLAAKNLSRTTEDSGSVVVPLIPWSAAGVFAAQTLAVPTIHYLPWAIMNYTGFLFALLYGATGFAIAPRTRHNEKLRGS